MASVEHLIENLLDAQENDLHRKFYSSDAFPTKGVPNGYVIQMEDTKDVFIFDAEKQTWIKHMTLEQETVNYCTL